jgi:hypothetical protein
MSVDTVCVGERRAVRDAFDVSLVTRDFLVWTSAVFTRMDGRWQYREGFDGVTQIGTLLRNAVVCGIHYSSSIQLIVHNRASTPHTT